MAAEAIVSGIYDMHLENDVLKLSEDQILISGSADTRKGILSPLHFNRNIVLC